MLKGQLIFELILTLELIRGQGLLFLSDLTPLVELDPARQWE